MVGKIQVIEKWQPFIEETKDAGKMYSAYQMSMTMMSVIVHDVAVKSCDPIYIITKTANLSYALKNIENDDNIDFDKRKEMSRDLAQYISEQNEIFGNNCNCVKK